MEAKNLLEYAVEDSPPPHGGAPLSPPPSAAAPSPSPASSERPSVSLDPSDNSLSFPAAPAATPPAPCSSCASPPPSRVVAPRGPSAPAPSHPTPFPCAASLWRGRPAGAAERWCPVGAAPSCAVSPAPPARGTRGGAGRGALAQGLTLVLDKSVLLQHYGL